MAPVNRQDSTYRLHHSAAHVMAQAIEEMFPEAKLGCFAGPLFVRPPRIFVARVGQRNASEYGSSDRYPPWLRDPYTFTQRRGVARQFFGRRGRVLPRPSRSRASRRKPGFLSFSTRSDTIAPPKYFARRMSCSLLTGATCAIVPPVAS